MSCDNMVGVKNIILSFQNCDTGEIIRSISHEQANDDLPVWRTCPFTTEALPGGYVKRTFANRRAEITVIRDTRVPLSWYQGCASVSIQVEYYNGIVMTGDDGNVTEDNGSDTHEVGMTIIFREVDELLPPGAIAVAA